MATKKKKTRKSANKSVKTKKRPAKKPSKTSRSTGRGKVKKAKAKKVKKVMKKKGEKKTTKAKAKSKPVKTSRSTGQRKPAGKKAAKKAIQAVKDKMLGKVVHYYDKIGVAIVELKSPLSVGDNVTFKRGEHVHSQIVGSMQINHSPIERAKKGDVVGVQVSQEIADGAVVQHA